MLVAKGSFQICKTGEVAPRASLVRRNMLRFLAIFEYSNYTATFKRRLSTVDLTQFVNF